MASGGARAHSGPPPDPQSLRSGGRDADSWITLPAEGRQGDPPEFPLPRQSKREGDLWAKLWVKPQAIMWEANGLDDEVALHVRTFVAAEKVSAPVTMRTLVKQQREELGLSLSGMHRNRWRIATSTPEPAASTQATASTSSAPSGRERFAVINGGNGDA